MKFRAILLALAAAAVNPAGAAEPNSLSSEEKAAGWALLFDGATLKGWRGYGLSGLPEAGWMIEGGLLKTVPKVKGKELITERKFRDFELSWEWRVAPGGNNGIKYFVTEDRPKAPGHEYQMLDDERHPDAIRGDTHKTAAFYDVLAAAPDKPVKPAGEWNASRILVRGNLVEHWLNGQRVLTYELGSDSLKAALAKSKFKSFEDFGTKIPGHIMLTYHNDECWFRSIKVRAIE
ncbi:MAG: DUF1080 domain-containing protein [Verrucomicrobiae bacterium]|nr:DUF1080 domain-containing protein [Verrucomicrobiae bacterium]